jgi:hypothetical protein
MELKELDNYQLVLLTLLISFVSSIATAIITVYLLQQSPTVNSVINQVIQRTIEQTAPTEITQSDQPKTQAQTIIIKEDDLIAQALSQGFKEVGGIYTTAPSSSTTAQTTPIDLTASAVGATTETQPTKFPDVLVGLGVLIDTNGMFLTQGKYEKSDGDIVMISGSAYAITKSTYIDTSDLSILTLVPGSKSPTFADLKPEGVGDLAKVGQTALVIGLNGKFIKSTIISVAPPGKDALGLGSIITLQDTVSSKYIGGPVLSNDGRIIGIVGFDGEGLVSIRGSDGIQKALIPAPAPPKAK